jgi:hypothetical protein
MWGIGTEPIFRHDHLQMPMIAPQLGQKAFGRIAFTIIFLVAILFQNRFGHQRNHVTPVWMNQRRPQQLMRVGDRPVPVVGFQTRRTMNGFGGKIPRPIQGQ